MLTLPGPSEQWEEQLLLCPGSFCSLQPGKSWMFVFNVYFSPQHLGEHVKRLLMPKWSLSWDEPGQNAESWWALSGAFALPRSSLLQRHFKFSQEGSGEGAPHTNWYFSIDMSAFNPVSALQVALQTGGHPGRLTRADSSDLVKLPSGDPSHPSLPWQWKLVALIWDLNSAVTAPLPHWISSFFKSVFN